MFSRIVITFFPISEELRDEIHKKYVPPQNYYPPNISCSVNPAKPVIIEDLVKFVVDQSSCGKGDQTGHPPPPILLCGKRGTGKSLVLQNLAYKLSRPDVTAAFDLVLYLDNWNRMNWNQQCTFNKNAQVMFWDQVFGCIVGLAPATVSKYGLDSIKAVVRSCVNDILFLVNWDMSSVGPVQKEIRQGTWVFAFSGPQPPPADWQILAVEPYAEAQVENMLQGLNPLHADSVIRLYKEYDYKSILTSLDMISIFSELKSTAGMSTDFDMAELYVNKQLKGLADNCSENVQIKLGELAFRGICKGWPGYKECDLSGVDVEVRNKFLVDHKDGRCVFVHLIAQDFLAAKYVVSQPEKASKEWLPRGYAFKRAFKFACSMWCRDKKQFEKNQEIKNYIRQFLIHLLNIQDMFRDDGVDNRKGNDVEAMEVDRVAAVKKKPKPKKPPKFTNPEKVFFSKWNFLMYLDDACYGRGAIQELFAELLSRFPCWKFKSDFSLDSGRLRRLEKILSKVKLNKDRPVTVRLDSTTDITMLVKLWHKLKNIKSLHNRVSIKLSILYGEAVPVVFRESLAELPDVIARADCPFYITQYTGPFICTKTPEFFKCACMRKLQRLDVSVYDLVSLREVMSCQGISSVKEVLVRVDLSVAEQTFSQSPNTTMEVPKYIDLSLTVTYFPNIQALLDSFRCRHRLRSLSIHGLFVDDQFSLDLTAFKNLESFNVRCEPAPEEKAKVPPGQFNFSLELMEVDEDVQVSNRIRKQPRCNWMFALVMRLVLPKRLERLLLRNVEFYSDSNNHLLLNFFKKYRLQRLVLLDSWLSLKGVRKVVSTHSEGCHDDLETMTKKLKVDRSDSSNLRALIAKQPRLSVEEREAKQRNKPHGKEIIITSELSLCTQCESFPCRCPPQAGIDSRDTFEDLIYLIEDIYGYEILSFTYTSNIFTIRKDLCGDLRVHCFATELDDDVAAQIDAGNSSSSWLYQLFLTLTLAQCICFFRTNLSSRGAVDVIRHLKKYKMNHSAAGRVEPFSLTVGSLCHSDEDRDEAFATLIEFLKAEDCVAMFNLWCMCPDKCFKFKRAHNGQIYLNDKLIDDIKPRR